jgi:putative toxin-antitoxin system antitoxin component (TIGR02293 family)
MKKIMTETDVLGGVKVLGQKISNRLDFHALILKGMPVGVITHTKKEYDLSDEAIGRIIGVCGRTVSMRRKEAFLTPEKRLSLSESDRLYRFARIVSLAENVFQGKEEALHWLCSPQKDFKKQIPFDLLQTYVGACAIEKLLSHIQWQRLGVIT